MAEARWTFRHSGSERIDILLASTLQLTVPQRCSEGRRSTTWKLIESVAKHLGLDIELKYPGLFSYRVARPVWVHLSGASALTLVIQLLQDDNHVSQNL